MNVSDAAHYSMHNRKQVEDAQVCGCYHCLKVFSPSEIKEYTDVEDKLDDTVICPHCDVDCVLPEMNIKLTEESLSAIRKYWLNK